MPDRKKVIKGLEYCITHYNCRDNRKPDCPYLDLCEPIKDATGNTLMRDALALLKEQGNCENCAIAIEDRQPVIRCKDCKHWEQQTGHCPYNSIFTHSEWFCADGERK